jgi:outer membrane receptor for ferrienterochelin and colicin
LQFNITLALSKSCWSSINPPHHDYAAYGFQTEYFTVCTRLTLQLNKQLELGAGIDNLFKDQAYVSHPLPQRTFALDLKAKW